MTEMTPTNQTIQLSEYRPHPRNYNRHPAAQVERIAHSLATFGQVRSVVVWRGTILAGHGVVEAARSLGWGELRADVLPDNYPEHLALAYVAADNELSRLSDPDLAQLANILDEAKQTDEELLLAIGYDDAEFDRLLGEVEMTTIAPVGGGDSRSKLGENSQKTVRIVVAVDDVATIERAISASNILNRGDAFLAICRRYLGEQDEAKRQLDAEIESLIAP